MAEKCFRYRIYPNVAQAEVIKKTFGCCRFVYNHFLALRKQAWENERKTLNYIDCCYILKDVRKDNPWLQDAPIWALRYSLRDLDSAYKRFFNAVKSSEKANYPRFKSKKEHCGCFRLQSRENSIRIENGKILLSKIGWVKCKVSRQTEGRIVAVSVSQVRSGKYFVSVYCTDVPIVTLPKTGKSVGIDLGYKTLAVTSDGIKYENHKFEKESMKKLACLQRSLSRKTKGSANWEKARLKVARLQEHIANQRRDAMDKVTSEIVANNDVICLENLGTKDLRKNRLLAKASSDASLFAFRKQISYKAQWLGRSVLFVDRYFPSSQICSVCGEKWKGIKDCDVRKWSCPHCGTIHDRDINAAKNILSE